MRGRDLALVTRETRSDTGCRLMENQEQAPPSGGPGQRPAPFDWRDCEKCLALYMGEPEMTMAAASVGLSVGRSTTRVVADYFAVYHARGHKDDG